MGTAPAASGTPAILAPFPGWPSSSGLWLLSIPGTSFLSWSASLESHSLSQSSLGHGPDALPAAQAIEA